MKRTKREHANNIVLVGLNVLSLVLAGLLLEYEAAKAGEPDLGWAPTPSETVWAAAIVIALGSLIVLSIIALIYKKGLHNRTYLWWMTGFNLLVGFVMLFTIIKAVGWWLFLHFVLFP